MERYIIHVVVRRDKENALEDSIIVPLSSTSNIRALEAEVKRRAVNRQLLESTEDIVLRVILDGLEYPFEGVSHLTTAFKLQRINRDAYRNIAGSTRIRELALIRIDTEKLDTWDRIGWLSCKCSRWGFRAHTWRIGYLRDVEFGHFIQL